jgi:hypothetical protein
MQQPRGGQVYAWQRHLPADFCAVVVKPRAAITLTQIWAQAIG